MNRRLWTLFLIASLGLEACRSAGPPPPAPGRRTPGTGAPAQPSPALASPAPSVTPAPFPSPTAVTPAPTPLPVAAVPPQPPSPIVAPPRAHQDIVKLKQAGFSDEFLLNKIRTDNLNYQLTTAEILELRAGGISEAVIEAMLRSGQSPATTAGAPVARKAEFAGLARVGKGFLIFGTSAKKVGRLVVDGETVSWFDAEDPKKNFSLYVKNIKEIFNTCVLRPGQNLCLEFGIVTYTGEEFRFRDPGWKNGENRLVTEATNYFRQAFPTLFFSQRAVNEL